MDKPSHLAGVPSPAASRSMPGRDAVVFGFGHPLKKHEANRDIWRNQSSKLRQFKEALELTRSATNAGMAQVELRIGLSQKGTH